MAAVQQAELITLAGDNWHPFTVAPDLMNTERQIEMSQEELGSIARASRQRIGQALQVPEKARLIKADYPLSLPTR
jgi:hypothetical protein